MDRSYQNERPVKPLLLRCPRCESTQFIINANPQPRDLATCGRCRGRFIYGHLTDEAEAEAARAARTPEQRTDAAPLPNLRKTTLAACVLRRWLRFRHVCNDDTTPSPPK